MDPSSYCCVVAVQYQWCEGISLCVSTTESGYKECSVSAFEGQNLVNISIFP